MTSVPRVVREDGVEEEGKGWREEQLGCMLTKLGKYIRKQYDSLFPPKERKGSTQKKHKKRPPYKVWTASSPRDIDSAKAYILGSFPSHQSGDDGHGDGDVVQLVKVPNKAKDWDRSLTPHIRCRLASSPGPPKGSLTAQKACDAFEKLSSLKPANEWLSVYAPRIRERIRPMVPDLVDELRDQDILAMQMLCGYETIAQGYSPFCGVFTDEEWLDGEYYFDVRFHYMMGYGSKLAPYLGMPWVKTAKHLLEGKDADGGSDGKEHPRFDETAIGALQPLPKPRLPPNATHTQLLHPSFTHRESPAFVAVFLNLYNSTSLPHPASEIPPLDHRPHHRAWRTSQLVPFLGHVALERFHCHDDGDYVRAVVNGKQERMYGCEDGLEGACKWETFHDWVDERALRWGDWASVCKKA